MHDNIPLEFALPLGAILWAAWVVLLIRDKW